MIRTKGMVLVVQERDRHLLRELSLMRVIDREQAKIICGFGSVTRVNRRLLALKRVGLIKRFFIGTAGSKRSLYSLSPLGANLVQVSRRGPRKKTDEIVTASPLLSHQLGINEIYCIHKYRPIPIQGWTFVRWDAPIRPIDSQRSLIPDGYVEMNVSDRCTLAAFLEFDLGHENLKIWKAKVSKYLRYAIAGEFERAFNQAQFRVVVVTNSARRCEALRRATVGITDKIFWFTTLDSIRQNGFWSPIWFRPQGDEPISIL
jgi:hypothetical protein